MPKNKIHTLRTILRNNTKNGTWTSTPSKDIKSKKETQSEIDEEMKKYDKSFGR
jgi:hypothetical protein